VVSGLAASASALVAASQLRRTRIDQRRRTVFEHLREIDARLAPMMSKDIEAIRAKVLDCYKGGGELSDDETRFLSLLNALDMLAFARANGIADRRLSDEYVQTLFATHIVSLSFLDELQKCENNQHVYEHLRRYVVDNRATLKLRENNR
jgi:hypothetical protein